MEPSPSDELSSSSEESLSLRLWTERFWPLAGEGDSLTMLLLLVAAGAAGVGSANGSSLISCHDAREDIVPASEIEMEGERWDEGEEEEVIWSTWLNELVDEIMSR